jgi:hypothetical protein
LKPLGRLRLRREAVLISIRLLIVLYLIDLL